MMHGNFGYSGFSGSNFGDFGATKSAAVSQLQQALQVLAAKVADPAVATAVDGFTGPNTAKATNLAMTQYVKAGPANLRTGKLTPAQVQQNAVQLAGLIREAVLKADTGEKPEGVAPAGAKVATRRQIAAMQTALKNLGTKTGDQILARITVDGLVGPQTRGGVLRVISRYNVQSPTGGPPTLSQLKQAAVVTKLTSAINDKASSVAKPVAPAKSKPTRSPTVERLQRAIKRLGEIAKKPALRRIGVDGIAGPQTSRLLVQAMALVPPDLTVPNVGPVNPTFRQPMRPVDITANAELLARIIEAAIALRGKAPPAPPKDAPKGTTRRSPTITEIQETLVQLADIRQDPGLMVVVDGINGPKTTAAVNRALSTTMSVAQVSNAAADIAARLKAKVAEHGRQPAPAPTPPQPDHDPQIAAEEQAAEQDAGQPAPDTEVPAPAPVPAPPVPDEGPMVAEEQLPDEAPEDMMPEPSATPETPEYIPPPPEPSQAMPEPPEPPEPPEFPDFPPVPGPTTPTPPAMPQQFEPSDFPAEPDMPMEPPIPTSAEVAPLPDAPPPPAPVQDKGVPTWMWLAGGVLVLAGVGGTVYLLARKKGGAPEPAATAGWGYYDV